tara:strand:- start:65 stop:226 length:162 start_codon:yes stop_codon:yes gene_type:complete
LRNLADIAHQFIDSRGIGAPGGQEVRTTANEGEVANDGSAKLSAQFWMGSDQA